MSVVIHNVNVENPTRTWMQLMNARHRLLDDRKKWNSQGWFGDDGTMCLANAIRSVVYHNAKLPQSAANHSADTEAEQLVMAAINHEYGHGDYSEIPAFNDESGRSYEGIVAMLDVAIGWLKPHAQTFAITYATDVMTEAEKEAMRLAAWDAEDAIWGERGWSWTPFGWKNETGKFAKNPTSRSVREKYDSVAEWSSKAMTEFRAWLDDHEERGWGAFWDELGDCGDDKDCREKVLALR